MTVGGTQPRRIIQYCGGLGLLAWDVGRNAWLPRRYLPLVVAGFDDMGVRSLLVASTAAMFTGMVFALQASVYLVRFGAELYVGPLVALSIVRELGPVLTAILVGGKVASGITAELGSMKVTEQIDALRAIGVNYVKRLIDECAQDGGFILSTGAVLDDARPENLHAMIDAGKEYGVYR